jgi:hypothetical protein
MLRVYDCGKNNGLPGQEISQGNLVREKTCKSIGHCGRKSVLGMIAII